MNPPATVGHSPVKAKGSFPETDLGLTERERHAFGLFHGNESALAFLPRPVLDWMVAYDLVDEDSGEPKLTELGRSFVEQNSSPPDDASLIDDVVGLTRSLSDE